MKCASSTARFSPSPFGTTSFANPPLLSSATRAARFAFYNDFEGYNPDSDEEDDDEDDDEFLLMDDLDWRTFRKNLSMQEGGKADKPSSVSKENEEVLARKTRCPRLKGSVFVSQKVRIAPDS